MILNLLKSKKNVLFLVPKLMQRSSAIDGFDIGFVDLVNTIL